HSSCRWRSFSCLTQSAFRLNDFGSAHFGKVHVNGWTSSWTCLVQSDGFWNVLTLKQSEHSNSAGNLLTGGSGTPGGNSAAVTDPSAGALDSPSLFPVPETWN